MKQLLASVLLVAATVVALPACGNHSLVAHKPESAVVNHDITVMWTRDIKRVARTGDWILTRSYSFTGDVIAGATRGESVSHASVYDARTGTIIEALRPRVREVPLESLLDRNQLAIVVHPSGMTEEQRIEAVERARSKVGTEFDLGGLVGIDDPDKFYCSELVYWSSGKSQDDRPIVVSPARLMDYGEVVYWSGKREDAQVQAAARAQADEQLIARR